MLTLIARSVLVASLLGLALSVLTTASVLAPPRVDLEELKVWLVALFFIVGLPGIFIISRSLQEVPPKHSSKLMYAGCPVWMRRLTYVLMALGVVVFFSPPALGLAAGGESLLGPGNSLALGGFGIVWFSTIFSQVYSAQHLEEVGAIRRCPVGHPVSLTARFCEECGRPVVEELGGAG